jgi:hypothetical protein
MFNKVRDKIALYFLQGLYGKSSDFACNFYGQDTKCVSKITDSTAMGIVFQGPIIDEMKLRKGLVHYRQLLPDSSIAVSTWSGSLSADFMEFLNGIRVTFVESLPPAVGGIMNVNRQIVSTRNGIISLLDNFAPTLILKTRTDFFPWRPDKAIQQMRSLDRLLGGRDRIWGIDFNTRMDLPFSFSDIFQLGHADNMKTYWRSDNLYPNDVSVEEFFKLTRHQQDIAAILRLQPAEIFLARSYLVSQGATFDLSSSHDYKKALTEWFGILDSQHIELAFGKYSLAVPGYEPNPLRAKRKYYVKTQDWLAMVAEAV